MMLLPKDIAADAVESSSAAALAIAAADRIPCGRDAVAAADAAESCDESTSESSVASINQRPSFAVRTPSRAAAADVTIDPTALFPRLCHNAIFDGCCCRCHHQPHRSFVRLCSSAVFAAVLHALMCQFLYLLPSRFCWPLLSVLSR